MSSDQDPVTREECERYRARCNEHIDRIIRDLKTEIERRDSERREDHKALTEWMVRVESKVNDLPAKFQDAVDKKFERIFQLLVGLVLSIILAGILAYLGIGGAGA